MARRSDIEKQIAALQAELDGADTDDEIWIKDGDHEIKVSGKRATAALNRYKHLWAVEGEGEEGDEGEESAAEDDKPATDRSYFKRK